MRVLFEVGDNTGTIVPKPGVVGFHTIALVPPPAATARANYVMPTIISGGKDNNMNTSDDIINLQLRGQ
jgi:hypothetical protein